MSSEAVELIAHDASSGEFTFTTQAKLLLESVQEPLHPIAIIGRYRGGKSFLMSRLAGKQNIFPLGHTVHAHTKGVWAYVHRENGKAILLLDIEGLGDVQQGSTHADPKLWMLALLLPSLLVYNISGVIERENLESLALMSSVVGRLEVTEGQKLGRDAAKVMPHLVLAVRDFSLQLTAASPKAYLEESVLEIGKMDSAARVALDTWFTRRDVVTIARPQLGRREFARIPQMQYEAMGSEFCQEMSSACAQLKRWVLPKLAASQSQAYAFELNGHSFGIYAEAVVQVVNADATLVLDSVFDSVSSTVCDRARSLAERSYVDIMKTCSYPLDRSAFLAKHADAKENALSLFQMHAHGANAAHAHALLSEKICGSIDGMVSPTCLMGAFEAQNRAASQIQCQKLMASLEGRIQALSRHCSTLDEFNRKADELEQEFRDGAIGPAADQVLAGFHNLRRQLMDQVFHRLALDSASRSHEQMLATARDLEREAREIEKQMEYMRDLVSKEEQAHEKHMKEMRDRHEREAVRFREDNERRVREMEARIESERNSDSRLTSDELQFLLRRTAPPPQFTWYPYNFFFM